MAKGESKATGSAPGLNTEPMLVFDGLVAGGVHHSDYVVNGCTREKRFAQGQIVAESEVPDAARVLARRIARRMSEEELTAAMEAKAKSDAEAAAREEALKSVE